MALSTCRECGAQVSTEAANCPHCGAADPSGAEAAKKAAAVASNQKTLGGCLFAVLLVVIIGMFVASDSKPSVEPAAGATAATITPPPSPAERQRAILAAAIPTCKLSSKRTASLLRRHADWDDDAIILVGCRRIRVGMTQEQLVASWGNPETVNSTTTPAGRDDQLVYGDNYVYISGGLVTSFQTSH